MVHQPKGEWEKIPESQAPSRPGLQDMVMKPRRSYQQGVQVLQSLSAGCFKFFSVLFAVGIP